MEHIKTYLKLIVGWAGVHRKTSVVILLALVFVIFRVVTSNKSKQPQYQTATAQKETLVSSVSESGQVAVANRVAVTTGASGIISQVYVKSGDTVAAGEKIADLTLDVAGQEKQSQAWSSYLTAQNQLSSAQAELNTLQANEFVANQKFVTDRGVQNPITNDPVYIEEDANWLAAEAAYENQQNVIAQAQVSVSNAWLSYVAVSSTITAPTAGTITDLTIAPGMQLGGTETTGGTAGTTLATVANIKTGGVPTVSVNLSEVDAAQVQTGDKATITFDALPGKTFTGKVIGVNTTGTVTSGVTSYPATIVLDSGYDSILPNMSASASIITGVKEDVLAVPTAAIQTINGQTTVRVLKNGQITSVPVVTGATSDTDTEIVSGLNEGDTVVVGFVPTSTGSTTSSPFSSSNPFRGLGGGGGTFRAGGSRAGGG